MSTNRVSLAQDVQLIMHAINDACLAARVAFSDPDEVHRLWRYLNLLHASAYCGLTDSLSETNFFLPIIDKYGLAGSGKVKEEELEALARVKLDENGSRACSMYEVWAFEVVKGEARRSRKVISGRIQRLISSPSHLKHPPHTRTIRSPPPHQSTISAHPSKQGCSPRLTR